MRHLVRASAFAVLAAILAAPAGAQYVQRGGSYSRSSTLDIPHVAPSVAALAVRYGGDLQLSQKQLDSIQAVRQHQDSANAPWLSKLDSLRDGPRPVNPRDLSQEQRELVAKRRAALTTAMDAIRATNTEARRQVMAVLTPDQQKKAARLESDAQKIARAQSQRRADEGYYGRRRGDMNEQLDRQPED